MEELGLGDKYEVLPVGVEELATGDWIKEGKVDCIVSVLTLCSIPEPEKNIRLLYGYLKTKGRWFVYEHVRTDFTSKAGVGMRLYQGESIIRQLFVISPTSLTGTDTRHGRACKPLLAGDHRWVHTQPADGEVAPRGWLVGEGRPGPASGRAVVPLPASCLWCVGEVSHRSEARKQVFRR